MKSCLIVTLLAAAGLVSAGRYGPLYNPGTGNCIVIDSYDKRRDEYYLTLGSCSNAVEFEFRGEGSYLRTDFDYCLSSQNDGGAVGRPVILAGCKKRKGKQWRSVSGTDQWKNGYDKCLDYDEDSEEIIQGKCKKRPGWDSTQSFVWDN